MNDFDEQDRILEILAPSACDKWRQRVTCDVIVWQPCPDHGDALYVKRIGKDWVSWGAA